MNMTEQIKSVRITERTHNRLTKHAQWGDSMDDVINQLLDVVEKGKRKEVSQ